MYGDYLTLRKFGEMSKERTYANDAHFNLDRGGWHSWLKEDSELDRLRKNAMRALEDYRDAIDKRSDKLSKELEDKLEDSRKVINLKNLFK